MKPAQAIARAITCIAVLILLAAFARNCFAAHPEVHHLLAEIARNWKTFGFFAVAGICGASNNI